MAKPKACVLKAFMGAVRRPTSSASSVVLKVVLGHLPLLEVPLALLV